MTEGCLQLSAGHVKLTELLRREIVEVIAVTTNKMALKMLLINRGPIKPDENRLSR